MNTQVLPIGEERKHPTGFPGGPNGKAVRPLMINHLRDVRARRRGEELVESGFTLIELLVVIVVLGILAATVVFALSGVTGTSAVAACNSDGKTLDVAVQAYINKPTNTTNSTPSLVAQLKSDGDITAVPSNTGYGMELYGDEVANGTAAQIAATTTANGGTVPAADTVIVQAPKGTGTWTPYDLNTSTCANA